MPLKSLNQSNQREKTSHKRNKKPIIIQEKYESTRPTFRSIENSNSFNSFSSDSLNNSSSSCSSKRFIIAEKVSQDSNCLTDDESWQKELTEDDLEFLIHNTGFNIEQIKRWHVDFINKCSTGLITNEQFKSYYRVLLPNDLNNKSKEEIIEKLFCLFDIDGDGCLSFTEFLLSFWIRCKAPIKEKYTWIFNMLDEDRNGYLNYTELRNALTLCLNLKDLDDLLDELNKDKLKHVKYDTTSDECTDYNSNDYDSEVTSYTYLNTAKLIDDKLNQAVHLLHVLSTDQKSALSFNSLSSTESFDSSSFDSFDSLIDNTVEIKRENFLKLCEKYKLFRKLLLPIKYFYEENSSLY